MLCVRPRSSDEQEGHHNREDRYGHEEQALLLVLLVGIEASYVALRGFSAAGQMIPDKSCVVRELHVVGVSVGKQSGMRLDDEEKQVENDEEGERFRVAGSSAMEIGV